MRGGNEYKIDWNKYSTDVYPYALYSKSNSPWSKWEYVCSCKTKEECIELHKKLVGLPIYL